LAAGALCAAAKLSGDSSALRLGCDLAAGRLPHEASCQQNRPRLTKNPGVCTRPPAPEPPLPGVLAAPESRDLGFLRS